MDSYNVSELLYERLVVFIAATTGQGDEPDNMKVSAWCWWRYMYNDMITCRDHVQAAYKVVYWSAIHQ